MTDNAQRNFNAVVGVAALSLLGLAVRRAVVKKMDDIAPGRKHTSWLSRLF